MPRSDILIIGSGIAALTIAYHTCETHNVTILTKGALKSSNSALAQGGVAAVVSDTDTWQSHYKDTLTAGCYHNQEELTKYLVKQGKEEILSLFNKGVPFDIDRAGSLLLGKEGAHSLNRIVHAGGDATGKALVDFMSERIKGKVRIHEQTMALNLIKKNQRCVGAAARNKEGELIEYNAQHIVLASGGCGQLYTHTSNHPLMTGDGLAMAYRAGAELVDLEFIQFHPTMLTLKGATIGLISEAVRGDGAVLVDEQGRRVMKGIHPLEDLAPRDVVSRRIFSCIREGRTVFLNIQHIQNFEVRFPTIAKMCIDHGVDLKKGLLPVSPGMHFHMGGIKSNMSGETSVPNLYAVGEAACTGVHGANRLASNSLLEGIVFGKRVAEGIRSKPREPRKNEFPLSKDTNEHFSIALPAKSEIQKMMTDYVGIVREQSGLQVIIDWFGSMMSPFLFQPINVNNFTNEEFERLNMVTLGYLISQSAMLRTESRGAHFRADFNRKNDKKWLKKQVAHNKQINLKQQVLIGVN